MFAEKLKPDFSWAAVVLVMGAGVALRTSTTDQPRSRSSRCRVYNRAHRLDEAVALGGKRADGKPDQVRGGVLVLHPGQFAGSSATASRAPARSLHSRPRGVVTATSAVPRFQASEVASLIGFNQYNKPLDALVRCWRRHDKASFLEWQRCTGGVLLPEVAFTKHATREVHQAKACAVRDGDGVLSLKAQRKIVDAVRASVPAPFRATVARETLSKAMCARGTKSEGTGLKTYAQESGRSITKSKGLLKSLFGIGDAAFFVSGKVDGIEELDGQKCIVEHKRRQNRLWKQVPIYEEVQCQAYMAIADVAVCRLVQTMGCEVQTSQLARCTHRWTCIQERLGVVAQLVLRLCTGELSAASPSELEKLQCGAWENASPWPAGSPLQWIGRQGRMEEELVSDQS